MIPDGDFRDMWEKVVPGYLMVTFQYFPGEAEDNHE
jgi:hypothetical protein